MFDETRFNELLKQFYELKAKNLYRRADWKTDGALVKTVRGLLDEVAEQLKYLICDNGLITDNFTVKAAKGVTYYPRVPWIGVFIEKETARNGVYPVIAFSEGAEGFFIGCADSIASPQLGFSDECYSKLELESGEIPFNEVIHYDNHLARDATWFSRDIVVSRDNLSVALTKAIDIRRRFRCDKSKPFDPDVRLYDWCKVVTVDNPYKWLSFIRIMNEAGNSGEESHWVFRGQGNSDWGLASSLERMITYDSGRIEDSEELKILRKEHEAIATFKRELSKDFAYSTHNNIDLLSLMQHYGSKTRLLDFTTSPLMALFMANEQFDGIDAGNKTIKDEDEFGNITKIDTRCLSVWAINLTLFRQPNKWVDFIEALAKDADMVLRTVDPQTITGSIIPVFPNIGSARLSAQDGLFLMSRRLNRPLMSYLSEIIKSRPLYDEKDYVKQNLDEILQAKKIQCFAYKFDFPRQSIREIKMMLRDLKVSAKLAYPDLEGLAKSVTPELH